jgi:pyrroloquinoline quinone biosynthesis protein D
MSEAAPRTRAIIVGGTRPAMPAYIKLRHDEGRGRWLILAPERIFEPDDTAVEVLKLCDGQRTVADIASVLAKEYNASQDEILTDIVGMLQDLADKGVVKT